MISYVFRGASGDDLSAFFAASGPHVDDMVGISDDIEVVFDDNHGRAEFDEMPENGEQGGDI